MQEVSQDFTKHLANLSTFISTQGVSQVVRGFESDPSKFRDWIKSIKKYVLLAGRNDNQTKKLAHQTSQDAVTDYIQHYITENLIIHVKNYIVWVEC